MPQSFRRLHSRQQRPELVGQRHLPDSYRGNQLSRKAFSPQDAPRPKGGDCPPGQKLIIVFFSHAQCELMSVAMTGLMTLAIDNRRHDMSLRQLRRGRRRPIADACRQSGRNRDPSCCGSVQYDDLALSLRDFLRQCCWRQRQGSSWLRRAAGFPALSSAGGTIRAWRKETREGKDGR